MKTAAAFALAMIASHSGLSALQGDADGGNIRLVGNDSYKISCNTARHMVRERGYANVKVKSCVTKPYQFFGVKNGRRYIVRVDPVTRFLWQE
jgi:hypothetical protein